MAMSSNKHRTHHLDPSYLQFSVYLAEEIKKISVARIVKFETYDALGHAIPGGVYDLAMGPSSFNDDVCATCMNGINNCPGHIGHIELCMLCYNPLLIKTVFSILRMTCLHCFKLQISDHAKYIYELQIKMINLGYLELAQDLEILKSQTVYDSHMSADNSEIVHPKVEECLEILKTNPIWLNTDQNKNSESLKESIIKQTIKDATSLKCIHCKEQMKRVKYSFKKLLIGLTKNEMKEFYNDKGEEVDKEKSKATNISILANECRDYLRKVYDSNKEFFTLTFPILNFKQHENVSPVDIFFTDVILVTPPRVRPALVVNERKSEHSLSTIYRNIIEANLALRMVMSVSKISTTDLDTNGNIIAKEIYDSVEGKTSYEKYFNSWQKLQSLIDVLLEGTEIGYDKKKIAGLKQIIEKKDGIIRMHMMGKRVNYAARTVIIPDPNINVDELGIPEIFAKKLTYPVPVTPWNVAELRQLVKNGPKVHPGANLVEDEYGNIKLISADDRCQRETLSKMLLLPLDRGIKIVHRHLINGDILLLNRQPTLHRPSMMTHKARILKKEKTFRLHYSNCKSYNADFDGDEMNAHFLQNEVARSEGYNLCNVANQYLVPKDGSPLGGLIQDHMIAGVRLAIRGKFFNREDYHQLVFQGLYHMRGHIQLLPPSIIKPKRLWSGKQILSTIMINLIPKNLERINLTSFANIDANNWVNNKPRTWKAGGSPIFENTMTEAEIIIRNGELLVGILDKKHYGSTAYGLVHCMYELYGGNCAINLLTAFARLFTNFLQCEGFSLGVKDILTVPEADRKRRKIIKSSRKCGDSIVASSLELPADTSIDILAAKMEEEYQKNPNYRTILDRKYKSELNIYTNKINKSCVPNGLICKFPENNLQLMVQSGAKGSKVNTMQISCLLGQIELEGKRPPLMISGKTLPSFSTFETSPKSGGFIDGRFMTGIQPQDFFFHCMAGREGLIDTAVKTSRSGYLQRCLVKHLEGLSVHYDMTVRDSDRSVIQFLYGEDGLDITKSQFLKLKQLQFLDENCKAVVQPEILEQLKRENEETGYDHKIKQHLKKLKLYCKKNGTPLNKNRVSSFQQFSINNKDVNVKKPTKICKNSGRTRLAKRLIEIWLSEDADTKESYCKKIRPCVDPMLSKYRPDIHFGAVSEYMQGLIDIYLKKNPNRKLEFSDMMKLKYMMALAAPGEPVGILAAQSIGEPSTQMTLNTFHFAGRGEMNVTLGIPRLREILMLASKNIKTPSMDIPLLQHADMKERADKLRRKLNRVTIAEVLESINIKSSLIVDKKRVREYVVKFNFLPHDCYKEDYCVKPKQIIKHMSQSFFPLLFKSIIKSSIEKHSIIESQDDDKITKNKKINIDNDEIDEQAADEGKRADDSSDDEEMGDDDDDATDSKFKKRQGDECDYDEPEETEEINAMNDNDDDQNILENNFDGETNKDDDVVDILKSNELAEDYRYDKVNYLWCELVFHLSMKYKNIDLSTILREAAKKSVIWETNLIKRAITYEAYENIILKTEGINIVEMFQYNKILNLNRLYTNDIHAVAHTYGIEAATRVIVKEVQNVFKVYGITVDPRHLMLIADYMTYDGTFRPVSRMGMEYSTSPLQQMSFESALPFLKKAVIKSKIDDLNSPTSCLMVGLPCKSGTGAFSLINDNRGFLKKII